MTNFYVPLPAPQVPHGINFKPVNDALETFRDQRNTNALLALKEQENERANKRLAMDDETHDQALSSARLEHENLLAKSSAGFAQLAASATDPAQKAQIMETLYGLHPEYKSNLVKSGLDPNDYDNVAKFIIAEARGYQDPTAAATKKAGLEKIYAETAGLKSKNALNDTIAGLIGGMPGGADTASPTDSGAAQPYGNQQPQRSGEGMRALPGPPGNALLAAPQQPRSPTLQPQSYTPPQDVNGLLNLYGAGSQAPQSQNSGLILASDVSQPQSVSPTPTPAAQPDLVDTPLGRMTKQRAQRLGLGLALAGKGDAGRLLTDAANASALSKGGNTQNDKEELAATGQLATLNSIRDAFDSKYLNIPTRFELWGKALQDKFGTLSKEDQKELAGYTRFRQASWHNLNRILKDLSGTAVTETEMERQLRDLPNAGTGITDGDSPTEFATKLRGSLAFAHSAIARARWLRSKGFTGKPWESGVSIEDMPAIIKERGDELYQQLQTAKPNADPTELKKGVQRRLKREFGI